MRERQGGGGVQTLDKVTEICNNICMELKVYALLIAELAEKYPDAKVVYATDDEGNGYGEVHFGPTVGTFKDGEFSSTKKVNAICVN
jgi:hypothetical protein